MMAGSQSVPGSVKLEVTGPDGHVIVSKISSGSGSFAYVAPTIGRYQMCFSYPDNSGERDIVVGFL